MTEKNYYLRGIKGSKLHVVVWRDDDQSPIGVIHILHGMAEHCLRYKDFARFLVAKGYVVYSHDYRKHGKSVFSKEEVGIFDQQDSFKNILKDIRKIQHIILKREENLPVVLIGHSMGSVICRRYLQEYGNEGISKAIIMGTLYKNQSSLILGILFSEIVSIFFPKKARCNLLNNLVICKLNRPLNHPTTKWDWLSKDKQQVACYIQDPLCGFSYSSKFYVDFFKEIWASQKKKNILKTPKIPICFISGDKDSVGQNGKSVKKLYKIYSSLGYQNVISMILIKDGRHELLNEINKGEVYQKIMDWIENY